MAKDAFTRTHKTDEAQHYHLCDGVVIQAFDARRPLVNCCLVVGATFAAAAAVVFRAFLCHVCHVDEVGRDPRRGWRLEYKAPGL